MALEQQAPEDTDTATEPSWKFVGFSLTSLYVVAFGLVVWWEGFPLTIPTLNELANILTGFCAPLAFLWLFVATMVQAEELSLQRRELQLTRREFELSRQVAMEQAIEARNQATFIGTQTELMVWGENDRHLRVLLDGLVEFAIQMFKEKIPVRAANGDQQLVQAPVPHNPQTLKHLANGFRVAAEQVEQAVRSFPDRTVYYKTEELRLFSKRISEIAGIVSGTSPKQKAELANAGFDVLKADVSYLIAVCKS